MHLHKKLHNMVRGVRSVSDYIQDIYSTCDELAAAGQLVQDTIAIYALLRGLGPSYVAFNVRITSHLQNLGFEEVVAQINPHEDFINISVAAKDPNSTEFPPIANQVQFGLQERGKGRLGGRFGHGCGRNGGKFMPHVKFVDNLGIRPKIAARDSIVTFIGGIIQWETLNSSQMLIPS